MSDVSPTEQQAHEGGNALADGLRSELFSETTAKDSYKEAYKSSLSSADSAAEKTLTAVFSIATAYGALIALVSPEKGGNALVVTLPFVFLGAAAVMSMMARSAGISLEPTDSINTVLDYYKNLTESKRLRVYWAVGLLASAMVAAGFVVANTYGAGVESEPTPQIVRLTASGSKLVSDICGGIDDNSVESVSQVDLSTDQIVIDVDNDTCTQFSGQIVLPSRHVEAVTSVSEDSTEQ